MPDAAQIAELQDAIRLLLRDSQATRTRLKVLEEKVAGKWWPPNVKVTHVDEGGEKPVHWMDD